MCCDSTVRRSVPADGSADEPLLSGTRTPMGMPMDVWQTDDGFHVCLDLPGVDPDSGHHHRAEHLDDHGRATCRIPAGPERTDRGAAQGTFTRQLQLGDTVDTENIQASYGDGVLHPDDSDHAGCAARAFRCGPTVAGNARSPSRVKPKNRRPLLGRPRTAVRRTPAPRRRTLHVTVAGIWTRQP